VLATPSTIKSKIFQQEIQKRFPGTHVIAVSTPALVTAIESANPQKIIAALRRPIQKLLGEHVEKVILACTHFGLVVKEIQFLLGKQVQVIVPAKELPKRLAAYLQVHTEIRQKLSRYKTREYFTTADQKNYSVIVKEWFNKKISLKKAKFTIS
jgi:glutamate racemase